MGKRRASVSWKPVLAVLLLLPLLFAYILSAWLGAPREALQPTAAFSALGVAPVPTESLDSLSYGKMLFVRLKVSGEARTTFLRSLASFTVSRGPAEKPIAFQLQREWWSPPEREDGTSWRKDRISIWNPDSQPSTFYAVVVNDGPDPKTR